MTIEEELPIYKATEDELNSDNINVFNINPDNEIRECLSKNSKEINLYKINLQGKVNCIPYTNIIFYDNQNKTLPLGMDLSSKILVDVNKLDINNVKNFEFSIANFENKDDEFSKVDISKVNVKEYNINL